jgi:glycine cleavage system H protein
MSENVPAELKYAKSHEWVRLEGGNAIIGITDHAQHELTDVVFVELPPVGRKVAAGETCAVVESVKTASDIYSPMSGEVVAVNPELAKRPELVNSEPYQGGWLFKLKLSQPAEAEKLLSAESYTKQIAS